MKTMALALMAAAAALVAPAAAQAPSLAMLDGLERGLWQLRDRSGQGTPRTMCLGDARQLLQIHHAQRSCSRFVIADEAAEVTVHYTCTGAGHGRTTIRRETARLVQVDTQGIANSAPFSVAYEARRIGGC